MVSIINKLRHLFDRRDKIHFFIVIFYALFFSIIELMAVGLILPLMNLLTDFESIHQNKTTNAIYLLFKSPSFSTTITVLGLFLLLFYLFRTFITLHFSYVKSKFIQCRFNALAIRLFEHYLCLPYLNYKSLHSSKLAQTIVTESQRLTLLLGYGISLLSEFIVIIFIYCFLIYINWITTLILTIYIFLLGSCLLIFTNSKLKKEGKKRIHYQSKFYKTTLETFSNFKLLKFVTQSELLKENLKTQSYLLTKTNIRFDIFSVVPRTTLENTALMLMIILIIYLSNSSIDLLSSSGLLVTYGMALFRVLPAVNRIFTNYNALYFNKPSLDIIYETLSYQKEKFKMTPLTFQEHISFNKVSFSYPTASNIPVIKQLSLKITYGEKVGIMGKSGSGKSTFLDLLSGLIPPEAGTILIDNTPLSSVHMEYWRQQIGYVMQETRLFDDTIQYNLALGQPIDPKRVEKVLKIVNLLDFFKTKKGLETQLGEHGCQLSSGQKQRIGIARALYQQPKILILDEATSALDKETEDLLISDIFTCLGNQTIVTVSHNRAALRYCDQIIYFE